MSGKKDDLVVREESDSGGYSSPTKEEQVDEVIVRQESGSGEGIVERYISFLPAIYFGFVLQAAWEAVGLSIQFSLLNGGPASLVYGGLLSGIGSCLIAMSLAEMASIDPVVGAQYRWSAQFAPIWPRFFGLLQGWMTVLGWIFAAEASPAFLAQGTQSLIALNFESYTPPSWHGTLFMWFFTVTPIICNLWFRQIIVPMEWVGAVGHSAFWFASVILLGVKGQASSSSFVWKTLTHDLSGWTQPGVAFGIGLLPITFPILGADSVLHMSKEIKNPKKNVPLAMVSAVVLNSSMQWIWLLVVLYRFGDPEAVANAPFGMSMIGVYMNATNSKPVTTLFMIFHLLVLFVSLFNIFASVARLTWAFSQNNGLPFSKYFAHVSVRWQAPIRALLLVAILCGLISIINIGNTTAFNALLALPLIALDISYGIPILFLLIRKLRGRAPKMGPFNLGRAGILINIMSLIYIGYVLSFVALPTILPVTAANMNYAGPIVLAVVIIALGDWCITGRKRFKLPTADTIH